MGISEKGIENALRRVIKDLLPNVVLPGSLASILFHTRKRQAIDSEDLAMIPGENCNYHQ